MQQDPRARWRLDRQLTATWSEQECAPADGPVGTAVSIDEPVLDQQGRLRLLVGGARGHSGAGRRAGSEQLQNQHRTMAAQAAAQAAAEQKQGGQQ